MKKQDLMQTIPISRRVFSKLSISGVLTMAAPLKQAYAQSNGGPKRFVAFVVPGGVYHPTHCSGGESGIQFGAGVKALEPFKNQIVAFKNLVNVAGGNNQVHPRGNSSILTGFEASDGKDLSTVRSIDQFIADKIGKDSFFKSVESGIYTVSSNAAINRVIYTAPKSSKIPISQPGALFDKLFKGRDGNGASDPNSALRINTLSAIKEQIAMMEKELMGEDRARMQQHLSAVEEIEQRIVASNNANEPAHCDAPSQRVDGGNKIEEANLMSDLTAQALVCGLTNVATVQANKEGSNLKYDFLQKWADAYGGAQHHGTTHSVNWRSLSQSDKNAFIAVDDFWCNRVSRMLKLLNAVPENGGTMLDNTVFFFGSSLATPSTHRLDDMRWMLIGGEKLNLWKTNRFLDAKGEKAHNLHLSILNAFGIQQNTFGNKAGGDRMLSVL